MAPPAFENLTIDAILVPGKRITWSSATKKTIFRFCAEHQISDRNRPYPQGLVLLMASIGAPLNNPECWTICATKTLDFIARHVSKGYGGFAAVEETKKGVEWVCKWKVWSLKWLECEWNGEVGEPESMDDGEEEFRAVVPQRHGLGHVRLCQEAVGLIAKAMAVAGSVGSVLKIGKEGTVLDTDIGDSEEEENESVAASKAGKASESATTLTEVHVPANIYALLKDGKLPKPASILKGDHQASEGSDLSRAAALAKKIKSNTIPPADEISYFPRVKKVVHPTPDDDPTAALKKTLADEANKRAKQIAKAEKEKKEKETCTPKKDLHPAASSPAAPKKIIEAGKEKVIEAAKHIQNPVAGPSASTSFPRSSPKTVTFKNPVGSIARFPSPPRLTRLPSPPRFMAEKPVPVSSSRNRPCLDTGENKIITSDQAESPSAKVKPSKGTSIPSKVLVRADHEVCRAREELMQGEKMGLKEGEEEEDLEEMEDGAEMEGESDDASYWNF